MRDDVKLLQESPLVKPGTPIKCARALRGWGAAATGAQWLFTGAGGRRPAAIDSTAGAPHACVTRICRCPPRHNPLPPAAASVLRRGGIYDVKTGKINWLE